MADSTPTKRSGVTVPTPVLIAVIALLVGGLVGFFIGQATVPSAPPAAVQTTEPVPAPAPSWTPAPTPTPTPTPTAEPDLYPLDDALRDRLGEGVQTLMDDGTAVDATEANRLGAAYNPAYALGDCDAVDSIDGYFSFTVTRNAEGTGLYAMFGEGPC